MIAGSESLRWYAIRTRYKSEKVVAKALQQKGIEVFIPLMTRTRRYTRKIKHYEIPLINCYVFVRLDLSNKVRVLETEHATGFVGFNGTPSPISEDEIGLLRKVVGEIREVSSRPLTYAPGAAVEVIAGGLTGLHGKLVDYKGKEEFVVELMGVGYELQISIERKDLRSLSNPLGIAV